MNQFQQSRRYHQPVSHLWWLRRRSYLLYALRELSCLFIGWFVVYLLLLVASINAGEDRYRQFLGASTNPWLLLLNMIALLFVVLHAVTWFNQTPQAIVIRVRGQRVSRQTIVTFMYLLWTVLSAVAAWIILGR
jgi:fumarate reductase subunit C